MSTFKWIDRDEARAKVLGYKTIVRPLDEGTILLDLVGGMDEEERVLLSASYRPSLRTRTYLLTGGTVRWPGVDVRRTFGTRTRFWELAEAYAPKVGDE